MLLERLLRLVLPLAACFLLTSGRAAQAQEATSKPAAEATKSELQQYQGLNPVQLAGEPRLIRAGFTFTEGPLWIASQQALLFSDVRENITWRFRPPDRFDSYLRETGGGNGLTLTPDHRLVICSVETRRLSVLPLPEAYDAPPPALKSLVARFEGGTGLSSGRFNQTNDAIVRSDGTIYFTDPAYRPHKRELDYTGVFRLTPQGNVELVTKEYYPNGIALSPDQRWLYVVNRSSIERLRLHEDGSATDAQTLLKTSSDGDGMAVDDIGNLYIATEQLEVFSPDGKRLGTIKLPGKGVTNCSFGGADRKTLYVTTADSLTAISMPIPGLP